MSQLACWTLWAATLAGPAAPPAGGEMGGPAASSATAPSPADPSAAALPFPPIRSDRPSFTPASSTVAAGFTQVELGATYLYDLTAIRHLNQYGLPELLVRRGIRDHIELRLGWDGYVHATQNARRGADDTVEGFRDLELGTKLQLTAQRGLVPAMALLSQLAVPVGGPFSEETVHPGLAYLYGWELHERLAVRGSTGVQGRQILEDSFTQWSHSWYVQVRIGERLACFAEWFLLASDGAAVNLPDHFLHYGAKYLLRPSVQVDWHVGYGLNQRSEDFFTGVGIVLQR